MSLCHLLFVTGTGFPDFPIWTLSTDGHINNLALSRRRGSISCKKKLYSKQKINCGKKIYWNGVRTMAHVSQFSSRHGNKSFNVQNDVTTLYNWYLASSSIFINHRFPLSLSWFFASYTVASPVQYITDVANLIKFERIRQGHGNQWRSHFVFSCSLFDCCW